MGTLPAALALVASYFLGAIPTSYVVARGIGGIDLREHGSRNLGATNLYRVLGWRYALPVGLFDIAKGTIPVVAVAPLVSPSTLFAVLCGLVPLCFSVAALGYAGADRPLLTLAVAAIVPLPLWFLARRLVRSGAAYDL